MAPPAPHIGPVLLKGCTETGYTSGDTRPYYGVAAETTSRRCYPGNVMNTPGRPSEVIFLVEEAPEGGYTARALGESIFTEAEDTAILCERVRDAVRCHFENDQLPKVIRLHFVREDVIIA